MSRSTASLLPRRILAAAVLAWAAVHPVHAQSLAEAARLAEQQRQAVANDATRRAYSDANLAGAEESCVREVLSFKLTMPLLREFAVTHTALQREMEKDLALAKRMVAAGTGASCADLEAAYRDSPALAGVLQARHADLHGYLLTLKALAVAAVAVVNQLPSEMRAYQAVVDNVDLISANQQEIGRLMTEAAAISRRVVASVRSRAGDQ